MKIPIMINNQPSSSVPAEARATLELKSTIPPFSLRNIHITKFAIATTKLPGKRYEALIKEVLYFLKLTIVFIKLSNTGNPFATSDIIPTKNNNFLGLAKSNEIVIYEYAAINTIGEIISNTNSQPVYRNFLFLVNIGDNPPVNNVTNDITNENTNIFLLSPYVLNISCANPDRSVNVMNPIATE